MWAQLTKACLRLEEIETQLSQPETYDDPKTATRLNRELKELEEVVSTYRTWDACRQNCDELEGLLHSDDPELRSLAGEEFYGEKKRREALERQLLALRKGGAGC